MIYTCDCGRSFAVETLGSCNFIVKCPFCYRFLDSESDYGYGPITPCDIYVGKEAVATIVKQDEHGTAGYLIRSDKYGVEHRLLCGYADLECYKEADEYISEWLKTHETD